MTGTAGGREGVPKGRRRKDKPEGGPAPASKHVNGGEFCNKKVWTRRKRDKGQSYHFFLLLLPALSVISLLRLRQPLHAHLLSRLIHPPPQSQRCNFPAFTVSGFRWTLTPTMRRLCLGAFPKSSPEHDDNRQKKIPGNAQAQRIAKVSNGASKVLDLIYKGCTQLSDMDVLKYLTWMSQLSDIFPNRCILSLIQTVRLLFSALIHTLLDPLSVLPSLVIFPPAAQTTRGFFTRFFSQISHRDIHRLCHSTSIPPLPISRLLLLIYKLVRLL